MPAREKHFSALTPSGFTRVAYTEWGDEQNSRVLICAHGAARNGRDFEWLARGLSDAWRVVALDLPGRGHSEWLAEKSEYTQPLYLSVAAALIARLGVAHVNWIGSSMGGGLGIQLASRKGTPLRRLILNDSGPVRGPHAPALGTSSVARDLRFASLEDVEKHLHQALSHYGIKDTAYWKHLAVHGSRRDADGQFRLHHDPEITARNAPPTSTPVSAPTPVDPWATWDRIRIPTLVLRGVDSLVLTRETAHEMTRRGPKADLVEFPGCGHFPSLSEPGQIAALRAWLERDNAHQKESAA